MTRKFSRREWIAALAAGAILGFIFLGIGARLGMRVFAISEGQSPIFTIEGSIAVSLLGAVTGTIIAILFLVLRIFLPTQRWVRGLIFWTVCVVLVLRGLHPVTLMKAGIFLPLFLLHGILLHAFWCRVRRTETAYR